MNESRTAPTDPLPRTAAPGSLLAVLLLTGIGSAIASPVLPVGAAAEPDPAAEIVVAFVAAFNARDVDRVMTFFADDAVYHNMPMAPVQGNAAIRAVIDTFVGPAERLDWEILALAVTDTTVLTERIDRFVVDGRSVELPVMGAFEIEDGKITAWRDYFDLATWQRQMEP